MFADDIALVSECEQDMQRAVQLMDLTFAEWGLEMSLKKTKVMPLFEEGRTSQPLALARGDVHY